MVSISFFQFCKNPKKLPSYIYVNFLQLFNLNFSLTTSFFVSSFLVVNQKGLRKGGTADKKIIGLLLESLITNIKGKAWTLRGGDEVSKILFYRYNIFEIFKVIRAIELVVVHCPCPCTAFKIIILQKSRF